MSDFTDLLFEAEKLTSNIEGTSELPKVERSLRQVLEASNELYTRVTQSGAKDIQANLLLGSKGIDLPQIVQKLESISSKRTFEPLEPISDTDLKGYVTNYIQNSILSAVNECHRKASQSVVEEMWENLEGEWKQEKRKILNAMIGPSEQLLDIRSQHNISYMPQELGHSGLTAVEATYAAKIAEYNKILVSGARKPSLVHMFMTAAEGFKDTKVNDIWEITKYMLQIPPSLPQSEDPIASRSFPIVRQSLVNQAKKYLEDRYKTYMSNIVNENLAQARRGGVPGTYPLVRSYVGIRLQGDYLGLQDGLIDDRPVWSMIYYCLRSGDLNATLHCIRKIGGYDDLLSLLEKRISNPSSHRDKDIAELETAIKFQYRRHVRNATDPFKRIVFCVLGCCDVTDEHSEVAKTADDYLWLKLSLVRNDDEPDDHVNYSDLQSTILEEYGESYYDAYNQPHLYFQVLALTGQFEAAIEFLFRVERYKAHAVHIAIAAHEMYLLGGPRDICSPLISIDIGDPPPNRRLNISRLIMLYVKKFEITNPREAIQYFYMLRNKCDVNNTNLFMLCVSDLAQETKNYDLLFGTVHPNGIRSPGIVDYFANSEINVEVMAEMLGAELMKKGLFEDAIKLYDIANNQEEVLSLMCTLLSQVVHQQNKEGSLRARLQAQAQDLATRYKNEGYKCSAMAAASFRVLTDMLIFFDQYHIKQYSLALETLSETRLIPLSYNDLDERVNNFKKLSSDVCKIIPDVLLATMNMLFENYQRFKGNEYLPNRFDDPNNEKQLSFIREQAKVLTNFAGTIPYRMPGDTNSRLMQMEILMH